jgi:hypothetical protein
MAHSTASHWEAEKGSNKNDLNKDRQLPQNDKSVL